MSISRLRQLARQKLPVDVLDGDQIDEVRVLMAAELIVALRLRARDGEGNIGPPLVRVLAITPQGRRLLSRSAADTSRSEAGRSSAAW